MTRPFRSIPKELARNGRETLLTPVAETGDGDVWCNCVSGHLVRMTPLVPNGSMNTGTPSWNMRHFASTRSQTEPNILMNYQEVVDYADSLVKQANALPDADLPKTVKAQQFTNILHELRGFAHCADIHPSGMQQHFIRCAGSPVEQAGVLNRGYMGERDSTVHNLMNMQPEALGLLMVSGLNVQNIQKASHYSLLPGDAEMLEAHFERHLGEALATNLREDTGCLVVGGNGHLDLPTQGNLVFIEDYPEAVRDAALEQAGINPDYYRRACQTLEMADVQIRSDEGQAQLFQLIQDHVHGIEYEAVPIPELDFNFADALEDAYQQSQASKGKDHDRDR